MPDGIKNNRIRHITKGKESNLKNIIIMKEPFRDYGCFENKNNERIVCFNITKSYLQSWRPNLYECTRKYWRLDGRRAKKAALVFAVSCGMIVGVFKPLIWHLTENAKNVGRWEFEGEEIVDSPYLLMSISNLLGKRQNPVAYINM